MIPPSQDEGGCGEGAAWAAGVAFLILFAAAFGVVLGVALTGGP